MIERLKAIIVAAPAIAAVATLWVGFEETDGLFAIAAAIFSLTFVVFVKNAYGGDVK